MKPLSDVPKSETFVYLIRNYSYKMLYQYDLTCFYSFDCPLPPDFQTILHLCYMPVWIFTKAKMRSSPAIFYQGTIMLASSYCTKTLSSLYTYFFCTIIEGFIYTFSFPFYYFSSSFKFYSSNFTSSSICF